MKNDSIESIFVLAKEEELGERCVSTLSTEGYRCSFQIVDGSFDRERFIYHLAKIGGEVVVMTQFRMSPYTALSLVRDLQKAALASRVDVVALSFENAGRNEFIRIGGAGFVVVQPGGESLKRELIDGLRQRRSFRSAWRHRRNEVVGYLQAMKDERLFRVFALGLFRELGYDGPRLTHGSIESGKDLVFHEQNRLGEIEFVGVQAKVGDIHGSVSRKGNVTEIWLQTVEALNSELKDGGRSYFLDKFVILTSGTINEFARKKLEDFVRPTKYDKRIFFYDQTKVADLVAEHAPHLWLPRS